MSDTGSLLGLSEPQQEAPPIEQDAQPEPLHPVLEAFRTLPQTPEAQDWVDTAAEKVQAWLNVKAIADHATATANEFVNNIDGFKSGLVRMAHADPTSLPLALDLVPDAVNAMVGEDGQEHAPPLISHIQNQIAAAGVQSLAMQNEPAARAALDRYSKHLSDEDQGHLSTFIGTMATARAADHTAQVVEEARRAGLASDTQAHARFSALTDPQTGDVRFPNNWLRDTIADPQIAPATKAAMAQAHQQLLEHGDPEQSDPGTIVSLLNQMTLPGQGGVKPADVWKHAGGDLSLADTQMLAGAAFPQNPMQRREIASLAATLSSARDIIAPPENGIAGQQAFGRFVNWLMPEYRNAGPGSLDPKSENWILGDASNPDDHGMVSRFMPRAGDVVLGQRPMNTGNTADRPSLAEIFSGGKMSSGVPATMPTVPTQRPRAPMDRTSPVLNQ